VDEQLKRRLIGATVLIALAIIFLPMLLSHKPVARHTGKMVALPVEPARTFDPALLENIPSTSDVASSAAVIPVSPKKSPVVVSATPEKTRAATKPKPVREPPVMVAEKPKPKSKKPEPKKPVSSGKVPLSAWVVQVASFSSRASAEKLVKKLRKAGFDTMNPISVTVGGKRYFRVQVGPELEKQRARKMLPEINRIAGSKGHVVRYP
jgi:DedD protein